MKGLILIFVLLSGISSAIAQEKLWLDKNYQWTDDSIQAVKYALVSLSLIHISEPTRQAEISYAVFCLKKKKKTKNPHHVAI